MRRRRFFIAASVLAGVLAVTALTGTAAARADTGTIPARGLALLMVDRPGCPYCLAWRHEILPGYADTPEGRAAPLAVVALDGPWPDGLALDRAPFLTPTFILLRDRAEIGRIEGYPGKRHFWPLVRRLLATDTALRAGSDRTRS